MSLAALRRDYAEQVGATAKVRSPAVIEAFAAVPRERFLGAGPWSILAFKTAPHEPDYVDTPSADPAHLYADVGVALDRARGLNNGQPSFLAACIDALDLRRGERVLHVGCGVGYYSAIVAHGRRQGSRSRGGDRPAAGSTRAFESRRCAAGHRAERRRQCAAARSLRRDPRQCRRDQRAAGVGRFAGASRPHARPHDHTPRHAAVRDLRCGQAAQDRASSRRLCGALRVERGDLSLRRRARRRGRSRPGRQPRAPRHRE